MCEVIIHQNNSELRKSRYNGFSLPLHPFQIIAWVFVVYFNFMYFGVLAPSLPLRWHPASYIIVGCIVLLHIITQFAASIVNPVDNNVLKKYRKHGRRQFIPTFDRRQYRHVIENQFCHLCDVHVHIKSKHCSACNKCIENFDHHCKWLNNCIGSKNYWIFFLCVVTALLVLLFIFVTSISHIIVYHEFPHILHRGFTNSSRSGNSSTGLSSRDGGLTVVGYEVHDEVWLSLIGSCGILSSLAGVLIGQLVLLHIYLMCRDITTYEYIMQSRISGPLEKVESGEITTPKQLSDSVVGVDVGDFYENDCNNEVKIDKSSYEKQAGGTDSTRAAKAFSVDRTEHILQNEDTACEVAVVSADVHKIMHASNTNNGTILAPTTAEGNRGKAQTIDTLVPAPKERKRRRGKRKKRSRVQDISTDNKLRRGVEDTIPTDSASPVGMPVHTRHQLKTRGQIEKSPKITASDREMRQSKSFTDLGRTQTPNSQEKLDEIPVLSTACGALFDHSSRSDAEISVHRARAGEVPDRVSIQPNIDNGVPVHRMFPMVYVPLTPLALMTVDGNYALSQTARQTLFHEDAQSFARGFVMGQQSARQHFRAEEVALGSPR